MNEQELKHELEMLIVVCIIFIGVMSVWGIGIYTSTKSYQCTVTGQEPNGPFGGKFFDVSCGHGVTFSTVAGGQRYVCARIGDSVTVESYGQWYPTQITGDSSC